jgi:hypothetical protein
LNLEAIDKLKSQLAAAKDRALAGSQRRGGQMAAVVNA